MLVVDDEPDLCELIAEELKEEGHDVACAADGAQALSMTAESDYDVVLTDVRLPKMDGLTLMRRLRERAPATETIVMTGHADIPAAISVLKEGAFDYLTKPVRLDELGIQMTRLETYRELHRDLTDARAKLAATTGGSELIGHSPEIQRLMKRLAAVGPSDASVVIIGESGTGKELVARALHDRSTRVNQAFVAVNCAAFPDTLLESELFGHERGAFTGATGRRVGRFQAADGGTLFLDEVAELSQAAQVKLLRVLQEGTIEPLGSDRTINVDVRIVAATHRDLRKEIAEGRFREDLYYRINTIELAIPPLRERTGDLPVLVKHFVHRFSNPKSATTGLTWRAWNALEGYAFPGNVRELMHAIEHAVLLSGGGRIDFEHLPSAIKGTQGRRAPSNAETMLPLGEAMRAFERSYLLRALADCDGKRAVTASSLGISRKNLWEKLRQYGVAEMEGAPLSPADELLS
ncbi:MAG TPA: sigma-54 dependent transcriptional regulator [Polyangia bacterium]|nr:sigma-54 dependent transcriptional regulator [Polyangia bacterium]